MMMRTIIVHHMFLPTLGPAAAEPSASWNLLLVQVRGAERRFGWPLMTSDDLR